MRKFFILLAVVVLALNITACEIHTASSTQQPTRAPAIAATTAPMQLPHAHEWEGIECAGMQTCTICGDKKATGVKHDYQGGDCKTPPICSMCGKEGRAEGHKFTGGDCLNANICENCGEAGQLGEHQFSKATCTEAGVCSLCGEETPALEHKLSKATCEKPIWCSRCGYTEGETLGHEGIGKCTRCGDEIPITGSGSGDSVLSDIVLEDGEIYAMHMTHSGYGNFAVWMYDAYSDRDLLINEIGNYDGIVLLDGTSPLMLNIEAGGNWTYEIYKLSKISQNSFSGKGDYVTGIFRISGGAQVWHFEHSGNSNFAVWLYTADGRDLIINEIGAYDAEQIISTTGGHAFFVITADGEWKVSQR